ncbi:MAG: 7,8-didemethyl-8-hydroxy-5-deazariboflavin synthase subunit CofH, partial [Cyanobacteria bacterium J06560_2]
MIERILERALLGEDISVPDGIALLQASDPAEWEAIRVAADTLRARQVGDTVTYVLNRNINYTNICEQHCS